MQAALPRLSLLLPQAAWLLAAALGLGGGAAAAPLVPLVDPPTGLRWSAGEVQAAAEPTLQAVLDRAHQKDLIGCATHCAQIERVFARVLAAVRAQGGRAAALPWRLVVVRLPDEQAMALPEGQILLAEPFVQARRMDDAMLAFVLAHEMAHSVLEHERQTLTYGRALLPRHVPRSVPDMYTEMAFNIGFLRQLEPICHQVELEADEFGLLLAAAAGYPPAQALAFLQGEAALGDPPPALFSTHPPAGERLRRAKARLPLAAGVWRVTQAASTAGPD